MIIIYEQNYDEAPIILDVVDVNLFNDYCKYYFDNVLQSPVTHELYTFEDFKYESIKIYDGNNGGFVTWITYGVLKPKEILTEKQKKEIEMREKTYSKYKENIKTSRNFNYLKVKNVNNFKK